MTYITWPRRPRRLLTGFLLLGMTLLAPRVIAQTSTTTHTRPNMVQTSTTSSTRHAPYATRIGPKVLDRSTSSSIHRDPTFTGRPLLAVGTLKRIDGATSTVVVAIDRSRSSMPHVLENTARQAGQYDKLLDREFPAERSFHLTPHTLLWDARPNPNKPQTRAETGRIRQDKQLLPFADFHPGAQVSIFFRMNSDPTKPPFVINLSKVDPEQKTFRADIGPPPIPFDQVRALRRQNTATTGTTATASRPVPAGAVSAPH